MENSSKPSDFCFIALEKKQQGTYSMLCGHTGIVSHIISFMATQVACNPEFNAQKNKQMKVINI